MALLSDEELAVLRGRVRTIAVNCAYRRAPWADLVFWCDSKWVNEHGQELSSFGGIKVTTAVQCLTKGPTGVHVIHQLPGYGISTDPKSVKFAKSSGATAINLATLLGARKIILFGFDMRRWSAQEVAEKLGSQDARLQCNYHTRYKEPSPKKNPYQDFLMVFEFIEPALRSLGIEVVNATPGSSLFRFPIRDPREVLAEIRQEPAREGV